MKIIYQIMCHYNTKWMETIDRVIWPWRIIRGFFSVLPDIHHLALLIPKHYVGLSLPEPPFKQLKDDNG